MTKLNDELLIVLKGGNTSTGIAIKLNNEKYITYGNKPRLFPNLESAKILVNYMCNNNDSNNEYSYWFIVFGKEYSFDECQKINNGEYQYIDTKTNTIITFKEVRNYSAYEYGYIVFNDGDKIRTEREEGEKLQQIFWKEIRNAISKVFNDYITSNDAIIEIKSLKHEYVISINGTTTKIHILYNSKIMTINQNRVKEDKKCFPFNKAVDKYITFYCYIDKDISEGQRYEGLEKAIFIRDLIVENMSKYNNASYLRINYNGHVELED